MTTKATTTMLWWLALLHLLQGARPAILYPIGSGWRWQSGAPAGGGGGGPSTGAAASDSSAAATPAVGESSSPTAAAATMTAGASATVAGGKRSPSAAVLYPALGGDFDEELRVACDLAMEAGAAIKEDIAKRDKELELKDGHVDPVTATDKANEKLIQEGLLERFPSYAVLGEEQSSAMTKSGGERPKVPSQGRCWCIDPVDATTNFVHGLEMVCVSVGLCESGVPVAGVVFNPLSGELFVAQRGRGAFLNGRRLSDLRSRQAVGLRSALVVQEFGYVREPEAIRAIHEASERVVAAGARGVRQLGCGVLDLCFVACGRVDACFAGVAGEGWWPWDYCAAAVVVTEAGGVLRTIHEEEEQERKEGGEDGEHAARSHAFSVNSLSVICASSEVLAGELAAAITGGGGGGGGGGGV